MKLQKPKNPGAVFKGDQWYVYDDLTRTIIQSDYDLWRAKNSARNLQDHADDCGHAADYKCIRIDEVLVV